MKIMMTGLYPLYWEPHYAIELEIAMNHIAKNDEVYFMTCNGQLNRCITNPIGKENRCKACIAQREYWFLSTGMAHLLKRAVPPQNSTLHLDIPEFSSIQDLKKYEIDGLDIGLGVASSLVSDLREPNPDMAKHRERIINNINIAYQHKLAFETLFEQIKPDIVYLFNGRLSYTRPVLRLAQRKGILIYTHDRAGLFNHYALFENTYPHDLSYVKKLIPDKWDQEQDSEYKHTIAAQWFDNRRQGIYANGGDSFIRSQITGKLPDLKPGNINIGIFNSSDDEFECIGGWENPIYKNQTEALQTLINDARWNSNIHFYLRVHPNLKEKNNVQTQYIEQLSSDKITVIPADSPISTYDLIDTCDAIITYGSTVGIESSYFGTPSILLGRSRYEDLGACIRPKSHDELVDIINSKQYLAIDLNQMKNSALKYGYFYATNGIPLQHFTQTKWWGIQRNNTTWYQRKRWRLLAKLKGFYFSKRRQASACDRS